MRSLERENAELHMRQKQISEENEALRTEKDRLSLLLEEMRLQSTNLLNQEKAKVAVLGKEVEGHLRRENDLITDLDTCKSETSILRDRFFSLLLLQFVNWGSIKPGVCFRILAAEGEKRNLRTSMEAQQREYEYQRESTLKMQEQVLVVRRVR